MFTPSPLPRNLEASFRDLASARAATRASSVRDVVRHALRSDEVRSRAIPVIERLLGEDPASSVRAEAAIALADLRATEVLSSLLLAIEDGEQIVRQMAITALGELQDARATSRLERALGDGRPEVRYQAIIAYCRVARDISDIRDALLRAMSDADPAIRYIALRVAEERLANAGADRELESVGIEDRDGVEAGAASAALSDTRLVDRARELLETTDSDVAVAAGLYLARLGHPDGIATLLDVVSGVRKTPELEDEQACVERAGELGLRAAIPHLERRAWGARGWLRALLSFDRHDRSSCAWYARTALAHLGHPRACAEIQRDLNSSSDETRAAAAIAAERAKLSDAAGEDS